MKRFLVFSLVIFVATGSGAQSFYQTNTDSTAVPFLRIAPDARAAGMGDGGVACSQDANAIHWNLANLAFSKRKTSFSISYTPWLRALVPDINLAYLSFAVKPDTLSAVGISLRYFSLGHITTGGVTGAPTQFRPNEFAIDAGYTRKLSAHLSAGITARFIESNPGGINGIIVRDGGGRACSGDIGLAWKGKAYGADFRKWQPSAGVSISNIGTKMWYEDRDSAEFLPTTMRVGAGLVFRGEPQHQLTIHAEANRLLTPAPSYVNTLPEKLAQINLSTGVEYVYLSMFKVRGGYYHEFELHGTNRFFTTGVGIEYNVFQLDFAYLKAIGGSRSPLENTLRFSLLFNFDALRKV